MSTLLARLEEMQRQDLHRPLTARLAAIGITVPDQEKVRIAKEAMRRGLKPNASALRVRLAQFGRFLAWLRDVKYVPFEWEEYRLIEHKWGGPPPAENDATHRHRRDRRRDILRSVGYRFGRSR